MDFQKLYNLLDVPMTPLDCGALCSQHHPHGIPFCCDICQAVPAAYFLEWDFLQQRTDLWHEYRGDECLAHPEDVESLLAETPEHMLLLACQGPDRCQRSVRSLSCRQFPFFPYINSRNQFIGLAYEWIFEPVCWVISYLGAVTTAYREAFVRVYDTLFAAWDHDLDSYAAHSEEARAYFAAQKRRMPLLHRNGRDYLVSPISERMQRVSFATFRRFGPYR